MHRIGQLIDENPPGIFLDQAIPVAQDYRGRFFSLSNDLSRLIVFDRSGKIAHLLATASKSQSEFRMITSVFVGNNEEIHVYDSMMRTVSVLAPNLELNQTIPMRYRPSLWLPNGTYIHAGQLPTSALAGFPLHLIGQNGEVVRSFGSLPNAAYRHDQPLKYDRIVAASADGSIWAAAPGIYSIERWDPVTGKMLSRSAIQSAWFRESSRFPPPGERPVPIIDALWEDHDVLWVLAQDADSKWTSSAEGNGHEAFKADVFDRTRDFVLEAIDTKTMKVIATRRFDRGLWGRSPQLILVSREQSPVGVPTRLNLWKPQLTRMEKTQ